MSKSDIKVAHLVPSMDIGGVEVAIYKSYHELNADMDYRVFWIRRRGCLSVDQRIIYKLICDIILRKWRPDVVITSLWWAHSFGMLARLLNIKWIAFFHSTNFTNKIDSIFSRYAWKKSDECFVDSSATRKFFSRYSDREAHNIPYVFQRFNYMKHHKDRDLDIVWVGRVAREKRIDILLQITSIINDYIENKRLNKINLCVVLAGEIPPALLNLKKAPNININFLNNLSNDEVFKILSRSRLYLMTSDVEGISMTTIEAIQAGCVPVVRRVGDIANYLQKNACIEISDISKDGLELIVREMFLLLENSKISIAIATNAQRSIKSLGNYIDTLKVEIRKVVRF